jgi:uncharacterized protein
MLDQINRINLLYDIYAPLLTERQQKILHLYYSDNYSLGEIAEEYSVSRQAVHDLIQRAITALEKLEKKLGLYRLLQIQQELLAEADQLLAGEGLKPADQQRLRTILSDLRASIEQ